MDFFGLSYLMHHGIKGQKWGERNYQNLDGSLTDAGKARYSKSSNKDNDKNQKNSNTNKQDKKNNNKKKEFDYKDASEVLNNTSKVFKDSSNLLKTGNGKYIKKDYSNISDEELKMRIRRLEMEKKYGDLTGDTKYIRSGSEKIKDVIGTVGAIVGIAGTTVMIAQGIHNMKKSKSGGKS